MARSLNRFSSPKAMSDHVLKFASGHYLVGIDSLKASSCIMKHNLMQDTEVDKFEGLHCIIGKYPCRFLKPNRMSTITTN